MDGTLCEKRDFSDYLDLTLNELKKIYQNLNPDKKIINLVNKLSEKHLIYIFTARDDLFQETTIKWLKKHKVNYEYVIMKKPFFDLLLDDRSMHPGDCTLKKVNEMINKS